MAKAKEIDAGPDSAATEEAKIAPPKAAKLAPEWINCKVNVPGCHVGTIECRIPGDIPDMDKRAAAIVAAAKARGVALNERGMPQFGAAPEVEFLES